MAKQDKKPRCPMCGVEPMDVRSRMAEMPPDPETRVRRWTRIGRTYVHQAGRICDETLSEVTDVVR